MVVRKPNVLIVDDDVQALEVMSLYLQEIAYTATAIGGRQAIDYVRGHEVDVILLDVNMPIMDGFKLLEQFHNLKECINVPIVFVTGQRDKYTVINSAFMGSDGYLVKPVSKEVLQEKVLEMYEKKRLAANRKTVLAVDDDMTYLKLIERYIGDTYNVVIINSTKLALDYLGKHRPDLILLDYQMPLYNGASFMNMIHKKLDGDPIPVIILSGVIDKDVLRDCYVCNPQAFLVKPVSKEALLEGIDRVLNKREEETE